MTSPLYTAQGANLLRDGLPLACIESDYRNDWLVLDSGEVHALTHDIAQALNERDALLAIAQAARLCDIGGPSTRRLDAFKALGDALVAYNGAPLGFRGRMNPNANVYAPGSTFGPYELQETPQGFQLVRHGAAEDGQPLTEVYGAHPEPLSFADKAAAQSKADILNRQSQAIAQSPKAQPVQARDMDPKAFAARHSAKALGEAPRPIGERSPLFLDEPAPTWDGGAVQGWRDRMGGIKIRHVDGSQIYMQPGDEAADLGATLDSKGIRRDNIGALLCDMLEGVEAPDLAPDPATADSEAGDFAALDASNDKLDRFTD